MKSKYYIKTINFGDKDNLARILIQQYIKENGKNELSRFIRNLVVYYLSKNKGADCLILERRKLSKNLAKLFEEKGYIDNELRKLGINPEVDI